MHSIKNVFSGISIALLFSACSYSGPIKSGDLVLEVGDDMKVTLTTSLADRPVVQPASAFSELLVDGAELEYVKTSSGRKSVNDNFGKGTLYIIEGEAVSGDVHIRKQLQFAAYDEFPSFIVSKVVYTNLSDKPVSVKGWTSEEFEVVNGESDPALWSFQGQSTSERADWLIPLGNSDFYQKNYMGQNDSDYGGGIPVLVLWRKDAGIITGHIQPTPELVSLPVSKKKDGNVTEISVLKEYDAPVQLAKSENIETYTTFTVVFNGDCISTMRTYS